MAVKKDPRHTNNAILFVLAAILLGGAIFAGIMFGQSASEPADVANSSGALNLAPEPTLEDDRPVIALSCHSDLCGWGRVDQQDIVEDRPEGRLVAVTLAKAEARKDAGPGSAEAASMAWGQSSPSHVLCSRRMPIVIDADGTVRPVTPNSKYGLRSDNRLIWESVCTAKLTDSLPTAREVELYSAALNGKALQDPRSVFEHLPTYPKWLIGRWGWNTDDPQCGDYYTGYSADHRLDHYEGGGLWMVVNGTLWTAWDASEDGEASIDSDQLERVDSDTLLLGGESYFRCPSGQQETGPE